MRRIFCADCAEKLLDLPDGSVDAVVTDPPYGLGTHDPTVTEIIAYLQGDRLDTGGDFMGQKWDIPSVSVWKEVYRVLKPGGHVLCFGGTRSFDLISLGLRAAGFENRDTIANDFAGLRWVYGSGFPKSQDISKAIDRAAGAERKVLQKSSCSRAESDDPTQPQGRTFKHGESRETTAPTAPATPEAEKYAGWGTALKPSWEPILVFRKPLEGTVASNVLKHGTGGINVDGCRVGTHTKTHASAARAPRNTMVKGMTTGTTTQRFDHGRWPPNMTLTHHPDCKRAGTKKVRAPSPQQRKHETTSGTPGASLQGSVDGTLNSRHSPGYGNEDGTEIVEAWQCVEGCPVRELDEQSGTLKSGDGSVRRKAWKGYHGGNGVTGEPEVAYGDSGGASRFFPQFEGQEPVDVPFRYVAKPSKAETTLDGQIANTHPTKKPLELMRWLVRLVCPPGGVVLDPYCGSGTTLHAARLERMGYIGIERDEAFYEIATKRMDIVDRETDDVEHGRNVYDMLLDLESEA